MANTDQRSHVAETVSQATIQELGVLFGSNLSDLRDVRIQVKAGGRAFVFELDSEGRIVDAAPAQEESGVPSIRRASCALHG